MLILKPYENECYDFYIQRILSSRQNIKVEGLTHRHHIIPKCVGGTNEPSNLIYLYHQEHYETHRLLALENPSNHKLQYAWFLMAQPKQKSGYKVSVNADDYDEVMKRCSELSRKLLTEHPIYKVGKNNPISRSVKCIETQQIFDTCKDAAIYAGIKGKRGGCNISENCNGNRLSAGKHPVTKEPLHWEWIGTYNVKRLTYRSNYSTHKIRCVETHDIFESAEQAGLWAGLGGKTPSRSVLSCCNGNRYSAGKHPEFQYRLHWEYADEEYKNKYSKYELKDTKERSKKVAQANKNRAHKVICIDTGEIFDNANVAGLWAGYKSSYISACCSGKREWSGYHPTTKEKLHWKYENN